MPTTLGQRLRSLGPGLVLAAAGIGAGDVVVASITGIRFGTTLLWAVVLTAALKFVLTESLARWQLATGETVVRAWVLRLPRWVAVLFAGYLIFWTFMVGASLSSACGLAGLSLFGFGNVAGWGATHAAAAALLIATNRYTRFQRGMKLLIAVMAACVLTCAVLARPDPAGVLRGLVPGVTAGGGTQILALLGGIGGSVTVICYGYWMRAAAWRGAEKLHTVRADVRLAYLFTGLFGMALMIIAAGVDAQAGGGTRIALEVAERLRLVAGDAAQWIFLGGFWCTVFTAMLGVWQGVPQIYTDWLGAWRERSGQPPLPSSRERGVYLVALAFLAGPPLLLVATKQPVTVVVAFSIAGAFFMPFLAATLLYLNNQGRWMGKLRNRWWGNAGLVACLIAFGAVCGFEIRAALR